MQSDSKWFFLPEASALIGLAIAPAWPSVAMQPETMIVSLCTGGKTRTIAVHVPHHGSDKDEDCPRACHAICERKRYGERKDGDAIP